MPYFVFRITAEKRLTLVDQYDKYQDAKSRCRTLRMAQAPGDTEQIRMAFAETEKSAKQLLTDRREPSSPLEEWEA